MSRRQQSQPIGSATELDGHPSRCGCLECRAWREFRPMFASYQESRDLRRWEEFLRAFVVGDAAARERFYAEVPMSRHQRRAMEAKARKINRRTDRP